MKLSLPIFTTSVCRGWDSNTQPSACEAKSSRLRHRCDALLVKIVKIKEKDILNSKDYENFDTTIPFVIHCSVPDMTSVNKVDLEYQWLTIQKTDIMSYIVLTPWINKVIWKPKIGEKRSKIYMCFRLFHPTSRFYLLNQCYI